MYSLKDDFIKEVFLENQYPILKKIKNIQILNENINSINYLINTKNSHYLLRNIVEKIKPEKIEKICSILDYCSKKNVKVMKPIKNNKGKFVNKEKKFFLTKYYFGNTAKGNIKEIKDIAKNIAILHHTLKLQPITYRYDTDQKYYKILTKNELKVIKEKIKQKTNKTNYDKLFTKKNKMLSDCLEFFYKSEIKIKELEQLIHHDLHPGNIIVEHNQVNAIIDFNSMRRGNILEEIGFTSFRLAILNTTNLLTVEKKMQQFIDTYQKYNTNEKFDINIVTFFLLKTMLSRLSSILKKKYFKNDHIWEHDMEKYFKYLELAKQLQKIK